MTAKVELPKLTDGFLGKQKDFDDFGLSTLSHSDPIIVMDDEHTQVEIVIGTTDRIRLMTKLLSVERKQEVNDHCLVRCLGPSFSFLIRPPSSGFYKLQIYALPCGVAGPNFVGVFNYLIRCNNTLQNAIPFPKQYPMWKEGCYLSEPLNIQQAFRGCVDFRLCIPKARDVQVNVCEDWIPLTKTEDDIFEGTIDLSKGNYPIGSKLKVNVKFQGVKYNTLLEYTI